MTRKLALAIIVAEVAQHGCATREAIRAYIENRVSRESFNKACRQGMRIRSVANDQTPTIGHYWTAAKGGQS